MGRAKKVVKRNKNPMGNEKQVKIDDGGGDTNDNELCYMDKLPNEILMKILEYLDEQQLVKCRPLSSRWNEICCLLLPDKTKNNPKSQLVVCLQKCVGRNYLECITAVKRPVDDFIKCFSPSEPHRPRPFPFSHFRIACFRYLEVIQVCVSTFGSLLKTVIINVDSKVIENFQKLWKLLLRFAPNIQHLGIFGHYSSLSKVNLTTKFNSNSDDGTFLENLKVLEIRSNATGPFEFVKVILDNAPNIEEVLSLGLREYANVDEWENLEVLQKLNKAHLVKKLDVSIYSQSNLSPPAVLMKNLQLGNLTAFCLLPSNYVENEKSMTNYIHHALKSSQDTLSKLHLQDLSVRCMKLCFKNISSLPNVRQLELSIRYSTEPSNILEQFSQLCPNVTSLYLRGLGDEFSQAAPILWTQFIGLKSLKLDIHVKSYKNILHELDSPFCGYSQESIQNIQSKLDEGIYLEEARQDEQQNPSILDLKDLSRLEVEFPMGKRNNKSEKIEYQLRNCLFIKISPQHIRENPRSILFRYL